MHARRYAPSLHALYDVFAQANSDKGPGADARARDTLMDLSEWETFLNMGQLIDEDFTKRQAAQCFQWAQSFCTDDMKRRLILTHLSYADSLEPPPPPSSLGSPRLSPPRVCVCSFYTGTSTSSKPSPA